MFHIINLIPFDRKENYLLNRITDVTFIIKTLERKTQLINQLYSIQNLMFKGPILIADDSREPYGDEILSLFPELNITYFPMEYDSGTSAGRNLMLANCKTPYFILCDDDFIFEPRTKIPLMRKLLVENNLDILGGVFLEFWGLTRYGYWRNRLSVKLAKNNILLPPLHKYEYFGNMQFSGDTCILSKVEYRDPFTICDITHNFFIANTAAVRNIGGWNELLKGGEHQNFFIKAKLNKLKVATTRQFGIIHDRALTPFSDEYKKLRSRDSKFQNMALQEFGLKSIENFDEVLGGKFGE